MGENDDGLLWVPAKYCQINDGKSSSFLENGDNQLAFLAFKCILKLKFQ